MKEKYTPEVIANMQEGSRRNVLEQIDTLEKMDSLNKWVDSNLSNYVKKQMDMIDEFDKPDAPKVNNLPKRRPKYLDQKIIDNSLDIE
jgi:hypothetical protein